jgi:hypothetical protein
MCNFGSEVRAKLFLAGINRGLAIGNVCPSRVCRFLEYEDLPVYSTNTQL